MLIGNNSVVSHSEFPVQLYTFQYSIGPVVGRSPADREVCGSNPTPA